LASYYGLSGPSAALGDPFCGAFPGLTSAATYSPFVRPSRRSTGSQALTGSFLLGSDASHASTLSSSSPWMGD
jgi:hypothetical protein